MSEKAPDVPSGDWGSLWPPDLPCLCLFSPRTYIVLRPITHSLCTLIQCCFQSMHTSMKPLPEAWRELCTLNQKQTVSSISCGRKTFIWALQTSRLLWSYEIQTSHIFSCDNSSRSSSYQRPAYAFPPPVLRPQWENPTQASQNADK